ncbi:MAG: hypothetical protein ABI880_09035 [Acidobacteriota bacterium]
MAASHLIPWTRRRFLTGTAMTSLTCAVAAREAAREVGPSAPPTPLRLTIDRLVDPATRVEARGRLVRLALHAILRFDTLEDLFAYIDHEAGRWQFATPAARQTFAVGLLQRGVESRVVSMDTELPLEVVLTHTRAEIDRAVAALATRHAPLIYKGTHWELTAAVYREAFLRVRERWSHSLNCWSASPSISGRVLSNWFIIDEGIDLFGVGYDSTEHFWQAVKYRPDVTVGEVRALLTELAAIDHRPFVAALAGDQPFYFANGYAVEFLKWHLTREHLQAFDLALAQAATATERARTAQQRADRAPGAAPRFAGVDEKVLWGDIADLLHLLVAFSGGMAAATVPAPLRAALVARGFDAIYLPGYAGGRFGFLSPEFQALMLEIWKVKYLALPRFTEVIRATAGVRLDDFLDDGDSPDIPIPIYVGYLNRIREMALEVSP